MPIDWSIASYYIKDEGIYFFGGIDPQTCQETDSLMVFKPVKNGQDEVN